MKKWMFTGSIVLLAVVVVVAGNQQFNEQVERTTQEAMGLDPADGNSRSLGTVSASRFDGEDHHDDANGDASSGSHNQNGSDQERDGEASGQGSTSNNGSSGTGSASVSGSGGGNTSASSDSTTEKQEIVDDYYSAFRSLQQEEERRIQSVVAEIRGELAEKQAAGERLSMADLQEQYLPQIESMEEHADRRFQRIYSDLVNELNANGHDDLVAEEFRIVYEAEKDSRRMEAVNQMFSQ